MAVPTPTVIGRYRVIRNLGMGGMGAVFLARDPVIDRLVAIKLMRDGFDVNHLRDRFAREAQSIGRLHHPNVVTIFDVGEHEGAPFIAMEYVEGQTLGSLIRSDPDMSLGRKLALMDGLCAGLHYAHRSGIVHRDIKPANVMVDTEGVPKILDFGIARGTTAGLTLAGTVLGTLNYMSPEQLGGNVVDHRADIFSVGAVFYELLAGKMAFPGDVSSGVLKIILEGKPEPLGIVSPGLDRSVIAIVDRCLEKDAEKRYKDLDGMRKEIANVRRRLDDPVLSQPTMPLKLHGTDAAPDSKPSRTPGPDTRAALAKLRKERIQQQLASAEAALGRDDFAAAKEACQQAFIINPENSDALDMQERIDAAEQAMQMLAEAENELGRGALTAASLLVNKALAINPKRPAAIRVRDAVADARRKLEDIQRQARALEDALARARAHLSTEQWELAMAAVDDVFALDARNEDAAALKGEITERREAKRRAELEARARQVTQQAEQRFAAGDHDTAIARLRAFSPEHPLVKETLATLETEHREIRRRADEKKPAAPPVDAVKPPVDDVPATLATPKPPPHKPSSRPPVVTPDELETAPAPVVAKAPVVTPPIVTPPVVAPPVVTPPKAAPPKPAPPKPEPPKATPPKITSPKPAPKIEPPKPPRVEPVRPAPEPAVAVPAPGRSSMPLVIGAVALVAVAVVVWLAFIRKGSPAPTPVVPTAVTVSIDIRPWANIEAITRTSDGKAIDVKDLTTPCLVALEPGEYHVRAKNSFFPAYEFDIHVAPGDYQEVRQTLPGFKPEDEARRILQGK